MSAELRDQVGRIAPVVLAAEQILPVPDAFHSLLPGGGLQRGWTVRVDGGASARAVAWALVGEITTSGGWVAAVDVPGIGLAAAREVGVAVERVLVITSTGADTWSAVIGALIGAVDVVMFGAPRHRVVPSEHRRMSSRARERGSVLFELGSPTAREGQLQYDLAFGVDPIGWEGLGQGHGCLLGRAVEVEATGRRIRGSSRTSRLAVPATDGSLRRLDDPGANLTLVM